jgi:Ca2+-binding EF-hand superfamily protein
MKRFLVPLIAIAVSVPVLAQIPEGRKAPQPMTKAEVEARVKERFARMDTNRDGAVTREEIDAGRAARRAEMQDRRFGMMDANKDGSVSRGEFDAAASARSDRRAENGGKRGKRGGRGGPEAMLARADTNADGRLTLAEMLSRPMARFETSDANRDGTLTPEERKAARDKMRAERRAN